MQSGCCSMATCVFYTSYNHSSQCPYLQGIVEELSHAFEAAARKLVLPQPVHGILNVLFIHIDIGPCLTKCPNNKSRQPVSGNTEEVLKETRF